MDRRAELLRRRRLGLVRTEVGVVRLVAVGAPVAFELSGIGVDDRHALVQVAVGEIRLVGRRVDEDLGDAAERDRIVAAAGVGRLAILHRTQAGVGLADLQEELAGAAELEHLRIARPVAADPHVALVIDGDAVIRRRPLVAGAGTAPVSDQLAVGIELEHRRRRTAALVGQLRLERLLLVRQRRRAAMDHPDVVALVHRDADRRAEHPVVRQRLRPVGIDLEVRRLHGVLALAGQLARDKKAGRREDSQQEKCPAVGSHRKPPGPSARIGLYAEMWPDYTRTSARLRSTALRSTVAEVDRR